jgi:hypothetical protein
VRKVETKVSRAMIEEAFKEYLYRFKVVPESDTIVSMNFEDDTLENILSGTSTGSDQLFQLSISTKKEQEVRLTKNYDP